MTIKKWLKQNTHDLSGKTVAITGSTGGLGKETCLHLAGLNANLLFLNRNAEKSELLKTEILKKYPNTKIDFIKVDMQNFDSIKTACDILKSRKIDILILNAGAFNLKREKTVDGFDNVFQINFLTPYFITKTLLPCLNKNSKVVVVGSIAHRYTKINKNDIQLMGESDAQKIYGNSKRFLMFSLYELFKSQQNSSLSIVHPGITLTGITSNYPKHLLPIIKLSMKIIYMPAKKACLSLIKGIFDHTEPFTWIGPKKKDIWGFPTKQSLKDYDIKEAKDAFEIAEKLYEEIDKQ